MEKFEYTQCFVFGNLFSIFAVPTETLIETVLIGFIGGIAGMLAKDTYNWIKARLNK